MKSKYFVYLILFVVLVVSLLLFFPKHAQEASEDPSERPLIAPQTSVNVNNRDYIKSQVIAEFGANSVMVEVSRCESGYRQFDSGGNVLRGIVNPLDVGVLQINEGYHLEASEKLGLDIHTLSGNLKYAHVLYNQSGTQPWSASKFCWQAGDNSK